MVIWLVLAITHKPFIVCSLPAVASIVQEVGGNKVEVLSILQGVENPHTFSLRPGDMKKIERADLIFIIGLHMEDWLPEGILKEKGYSLGDSLGIKGNPHIWLSIKYTEKIAEEVKRGLVRIMPEDSTYFKRRLVVFKSMLKSIKISDCLKNRKVVEMFPAFDYLLNDVGLENIYTIINVPGKRPSPRRISEAIDIIKKNRITAIVSNPFNDFGISDAVVKETGVKVIILLPQVGMEEGIDTQIGLLKENIRRLVDGLCG